mmetsp:Transcript_71452/g.198347  ORF Transcript_71452/g.198347 Transcript_71452/m.198347 type:complete len:206 (-) Transcript_71452:963-1580(-)
MNRWSFFASRCFCLCAIKLKAFSTFFSSHMSESATSSSRSTILTPSPPLPRNVSSDWMVWKSKAKRDTPSVERMKVNSSLPFNSMRDGGKVFAISTVSPATARCLPMSRANDGVMSGHPNGVKNVAMLLLGVTKLDFLPTEVPVLRSLAPDSVGSSWASMALLSPQRGPPQRLQKSQSSKKTASQTLQQSTFLRAFSLSKALNFV